MEVRVLGPPDVVGDDGSVLVLAAKQRRLLAALTADPGKSRTVDALIDALWPERPPGEAAKVLQVYVSRLRKVLPDGIRIRTDTSGYTLEFEKDALDAARFERLLAEARIAFAEENASLAVSLLGRALSLWRGSAFGELAYEDFVRAESERLEELRLLALEQQSEAQLRLGLHAAFLGNLRELALTHPLRERMQAQLMLALYRCGRQTEALDVYTSLSERLREELGLEPAASCASCSGGSSNTSRPWRPRPPQRTTRVAAGAAEPPARPRAASSPSCAGCSWMSACACSYSPAPAARAKRDSHSRRPTVADSSPTAPALSNSRRSANQTSSWERSPGRSRREQSLAKTLDSLGRAARPRAPARPRQRRAPSRNADPLHGAARPRPAPDAAHHQPNRSPPLRRARLSG